MTRQLNRFTERYRYIVEQVCSVVEDRAQYRGVPIRERVAKSIWYGKHLALENLRTIDGQAVELITPGWWNQGGGPDFLKAELAFDSGPVERGDVEIHLHTSDWYAHGHHEDENYNRVILHVALWRDSEDDFVVNEAGLPIRQLVIEDNLESSLDELVAALDQDDVPPPGNATAGLCAQYAQEHGIQRNWVSEFLDAAGDERIIRKAEAMSARGAVVGHEQAMYEAFLAALGYRKNKAPFLALAKALPIRVLKKMPEKSTEALQACLFYASGLLPQDPFLPGMPDPETWEIIDRYRKALKVCWPGQAERMPEGDTWDFSGTRPVNFPTRRVAAAAHFLSKHIDNGLVMAFARAVPDAILDTTGVLNAEGIRELRVSLERVLQFPEDPYWSFRCTFGGKTMASPVRLVGPERIAVIIVNVVLPALLLYSRLSNLPAMENAVHQLYDNLPALGETQVTRFMAARVFGDEQRAAELVTTARRQQGLYQLYADFERDDRTCEECGLLRAMHNQA